MADMRSILAFDVGTKTIGVARVYVRGPRVPSPLTTLSRKSVKKDAAALAALCKKHDAAELVVGLPYELDGTEGRSARLARQIGEALAALTGLPVTTRTSDTQPSKPAIGSSNRGSPRANNAQ